MAIIESRNLLLRQPWLFERIYPDCTGEVMDMCWQVFRMFGLADAGLNILDAGCGTGRNLARLVQQGHRGVGIDISESMMRFATERYPNLEIHTGDMRAFDLGETFDAIVCLGSAFTYNLSNADVHATLGSFRKHLKNGGILILDVLNACRFLGSEEFKEGVEIRVDEADFHATAVAQHLIDRRRQSFRRVRTWHIDGREEPVIDDAEYRLFFPLELEDYLCRHQYSVLGMWDNEELKETDLTDRRPYVAARAL